MADEVNLRRAEPRDGKNILELLRQLQKESDNFIVDSNLDEITSELESRQIELINQTKTNIIIVVEFDNQLIGLTTIDQIDDNIGELGIAILEEFQGYHLGTNLMEMTLDWVIQVSDLSQIFLEVFKTNLPAINLYKKFKFVEVGETDNSIKMELDIK